MIVLGCCAYYQESCIEPIVAELAAAGIDLHLWALDLPRPALKSMTRGQSLLPKWQIMPWLVSQARQDFDYVLFFDDDIVLPPGFWPDYLAVVHSCDAHLSQPALTHDSYFSHAITRHDPSGSARITNFVEIGPFVCMTRRFYHLFLPYLDPISPLGWGFEAQWTHLAQTHGLVQAIIDRCPVRHTRPIGINYSLRSAERQKQLYVAKYGNAFPEAMVIKQVQVGRSL